MLLSQREIRFFQVFTHYLTLITINGFRLGPSVRLLSLSWKKVDFAITKHNACLLVCFDHLFRHLNVVFRVCALCDLLYSVSI